MAFTTADKKHRRYMTQDKRECKLPKPLYIIYLCYIIYLYIRCYVQKVLHYPRLDTVLRVEAILRKAQGPLSKNEIDRRLKQAIMRPTLNVILSYLEESGKIAFLKEGILWIYRDDASAKLKAKLAAAVPA